MSEDFQAVRARYRAARQAAYERALYQLRGVVPQESRLRLTEISVEAITIWRTAWLPHDHPFGIGWPWDLIAERCRRNPKLFHLAIWSGEMLCGLALGHLSRRVGGVRHTISLDRVAGSPAPDHPLKGMILPIAFTVATEFGHAFGATRLWLMDPVEAMVPRYEAFGFRAVRKKGRVIYCEQEI